MNHRALLVLGLFASATLVGCKSPQGVTPEAKRQDVMNMSDDTLARFYEDKPGMKQRLQNVPGYAVFSNFGLKILLVGTGNGYGVVYDNRTNDQTYMKMFKAGVGFGIGGKDYRGIFVFNDEKALDNFLAEGWDFGGDADAVATIDRGGGEAAVGASVQGVDIYQLTETGFSLTAMVGGTKFWKDEALNAPTMTAGERP